MSVTDDLFAGEPTEEHDPYDSGQWRENGQRDGGPRGGGRDGGGRDGGGRDGGGRDGGGRDGGGRGGGGRDGGPRGGGGAGREPGGPDGGGRGGAEGFDRTPPQDVAAEQCVLGGMLLSKDAIADVVEILKTSDFYRPLHSTIYDAILDLYGRGEPADPITVAAALAGAGALSKIGGAPYLHTLIASVPTAANAAYYARIVAERAVLRRLVEAGTRIVQLGYGVGGREVDDIVDLAQQAIYDVTEKRVSEDFAVLAEMLQPTLDEIEAVGAQGGQMAGVPTGFTDLDRLLNGLHPGQLIIVAGRPGLGKSTAAMDFSRAASVRNNQASAIFSLEMSKVEIVMRLLSAEARVPLHVLRSGQLSDDDWTKLARRMGEISEAPLFVDDTPNMTMMEIRSKARRLKQRHDLKLIVVDYLQLMTSPKRTESRQQEVADLSRGLKLLAKEVECPVVAVSQLNRGPEQRTDKRPQLSDLRESGCLTAGTKVMLAATNAEVTLGQLLEAGARDVQVLALDERLRYTRRTMTHVFSTGRREVYQLTLRSGKRIEATANHRFLTFDGWRALGDLAQGVRVATPRHIPAPTAEAALPESEVVMMARLLSCGSFGGSFFGRGQSVPPAVARLPKRQVAAFLRQLWSEGGSIVDGCCGSDGGDGRGGGDGRDGSVGRPGLGSIVYQATNRQLLDDLCRLLLRFGITANVEQLPSTRPGRSRYMLAITGRDDQLRFLREIWVHGRSATAAREYLAVLEQARQTPPAPVPDEVWHRVRSVLTETGGGSEPAAHASAPLTGMVGVLESADLELEATNDVYWDTVASIELLGVQEVYDATVLGTHNFIANGIAVHNSIEQDADVVILLHRDDYYDKESPRAGEADFIVAKHRNGPTDTVTVAAQLHLSRFVDMAVV